MPLVVLRAEVALVLEDLVARRVPDAGPRLVRPREAERYFRGAALEHFAERAIEDAVPFAEPIVPVDERLDSVCRARSLCACRVSGTRRS